MEQSSEQTSFLSIYTFWFSHIIRNNQPNKKFGTSMSAVCPQNMSIRIKMRAFMLDQTENRNCISLG